MTAAWDRDEALRVAERVVNVAPMNTGSPRLYRTVASAAALLRAADAEITRLRAREEAAEKMAEALRWQPIETAPVDGGQIIAGYWRHEGWWTDIYDAEPHSFDAKDHGFSRSAAPLTHWMPLPLPPSRAAWDANRAAPAPDPDRAFWRDYYTGANSPT